jgi:hypothetical protein
MGEVVNFAPDPTAQLLADSEFVSDMCRYSENLITERFIRRKYSKLYGKLDEDCWVRLGENQDLMDAIEAEQVRRTRDGSAKIEAAQKHITKGPDILNSIMTDEKASPRHRVDAIKTLDALAAPPQQAGIADASRFIIQINMGATSEVFNKSRAIAVDDPADIHSVNLAIDVPKGDGDGQDHL